MTSTTVICRLILVILSVLFISFEHLHAAVLPIAEGNTWVYNHRDSVETFTPLPGRVSKEGLFTMRMDSVIIRMDTVVFKVTSIDSGVSSIGSAYKDQAINKYMKIKSSLFIRDTATKAWLPCSDLFIFFTPHYDTSISRNVILTEGPSYKSDSSFSTSRHTDSSAVIVNSIGEWKMYATDTSFSRRSTIQAMSINIYEIPYDFTLRDILQWVDSIGVISHFYLNDSATSINTASYYKKHVKEIYTILSFNGKSVSIVPVNVSAKNIVPLISRLSAKGTRKVFRLGRAPYLETESSRCLNLLGRKSNAIGSSQLFIKKKEL